MTARVLAFFVWAAAAASAVFWGLRVSVHSPATPSAAVVGLQPTAAADLSRLFGRAPVATAAQAAPATDSRFRLWGVVAPKTPAAAPAEGLALIAVDSKPARAYRVGASLDGQWILQSVSTRSAAVAHADGSAALTLTLPPPPTAATSATPARSTLTPATPPPTAPDPDNDASAQETPTDASNAAATFPTYPGKHVPRLPVARDAVR